MKVHFCWGQNFYVDSCIIGKPWYDYIYTDLIIQICKIIYPIITQILNIILMFISSSLLFYVRLQNKTVEEAVILIVTFIMIFLNTGVIILLVNAHTKHLLANSLFFNGEYSDFSFYWYDSISWFILSPIILDLISPISSFLISFIVQKIFVFLDNRFTNPKLYKTNCKLAYDYAELCSGAKISLYSKYSQLLKIMFISSMYGFGMPLLPLLMLLFWIISYVFEKYFIAFYYRKLPMYDEALNLVCIFFGKWSAFLYISFGYWLISNQNIFGNDFQIIKFQAEILESNHSVFDIPEKPQQVLVLAFALLILLYLVIDFVRIVLRIIFKTTLNQNKLEIEDLPLFHDALDKNNLEFWVQEENFIRNKLGYKYLFDEFYEKLKQRLLIENSIKVKPTSEINDYILDITNYDLLYMQSYSSQYAYIPVCKRKHGDLDASSVLTRFLLDFPYHQQLSIQLRSNLTLEFGSRQFETEYKI